MLRIALHYSHDPYCYCEYFKYAESRLGYELEDNTCRDMAIAPPMSTPNVEKHALLEIYDELNGAQWINNTGWTSEDYNFLETHCNWFGISCNDDGQVSGIDLRSNQLAGSFPSRSLSSLYDLRSLDLANNTVWGNIDSISLFKLRNLQHVDISLNDLSGEADFLGGAVEYLNMSHNNFTSITRFQPYKGNAHLRTIDLSYNRISQEASGILEDLPPNLRDLILSSNAIHGTLPDPLPTAERLREFLLNNNLLSGTVPDISRSYPSLRVLNLANQSWSGNGGLSGQIPLGWTNLPDLGFLDLSYNQLTGRLTPEIGSLPQIKVLNISNNILSENYIPTEIGRLAGIVTIFNSSNNNLQGFIPSELGRFDGAAVLLRGNDDTITPAPLSLCGVQGFDLRNDPMLCPPERNVLKEFYEAAKGQEWTDQDYWLDEYSGHCAWYGVECSSSSGNITQLNLTSNGLSGKLSKRISELRSLEVLDLNDNDMKGTIPSELGLLSNLTHLRLSYNAFVGTVPKEIAKLQHLQLVHIHSNRLSGEMPGLNTQQLLQTSSSLIADCGVPSQNDEPLDCPDCTICCNANGECHSTEETKLEQANPQSGFGSYAEFIWVFFLLLLGYVVVVVVASYLYDRLWIKSVPRNLTERSVINSDKKYAIDTIGADSVYSFFLTKSWMAWGFALAVMVIQVLTLYIFVGAAVKDFSNDRSDYVYSWRCPRNSLECIDESDLDWRGWAVFAVLMTSHLSKDVINGIKLLLLCGKRRHTVHSKARFFAGGLFLTWVAAFTVYASTVYNIAIARSNTEVIVNAVIILFIVDMDEQFYAALMAANTFWVAGLTNHRQPPDDSDKKDDEADSLADQVEQLKSLLHDRDEQMEALLQEMRLSNERLETRLRNLELKKNDY